MGTKWVDKEANQETWGNSDNSDLMDKVSSHPTESTSPMRPEQPLVQM